MGFWSWLQSNCFRCEPLGGGCKRGWRGLVWRGERNSWALRHRAKRRRSDCRRGRCARRGGRRFPARAGNDALGRSTAMTRDGLSALGFAIFEEIKEAVVDAGDGSEEFINPHGFASYFVCGRVPGYGVAQLSGTADTLSSNQGEHRMCIVVPRLALLPLLNGPRRLAHIIHFTAEFREDARNYWAGAHVVLQPDEVGAGFL